MFNIDAYYKYINYLEKKIRYTNIIIISISVLIGIISGIWPLIITLPLGKYIVKKENAKTTKIIKQLKAEVLNINNADYPYPKTQNIQFYKDFETTLVDYKKYYSPNIYITTLNELHFYEVLLEIAKELDLILFSQVCLYSIVKVKKSLDYSTRTTYFNKINKKSIDFVLVDKSNCRIKLCIELDDNTHKNKKRIERDNFINELFSQLEINLLRYPVYSVYYKETLKNRILEKIK